MSKNEKIIGITAKKDEDFSEWYTQAIVKGDFADYSAVSGCMVFKPASYAIWEQIRNTVDVEFKKIGIQNAYFPLFIPESLLQREAKHVEGFSPEVAWVTHGGGTELGERLAVRPTSEAIMYDSYSKWIRSYRDLPLRYNQWNNVVRWEFKNPVAFLRTREFLWNEGHTVFATQKEADAEITQILDIYEQFVEDYLALAGIRGLKTDHEKFAGAEATRAIEYALPSNKVIQGPDAHSDGQNFAKAYDIKFLDDNNKEAFAWQNTWAITTRMIGVMLAVHGDDNGFVVPPKIAEIQAVIVPIVFDDSKKKILAAAGKAFDSLKEIRTRLDDRDNYSPGWKYSHWELRGVPLRIEIGPKDVEKKQAMLVRRDTREKIPVKLDKLATVVPKVLDAIQANLLEKAKKFLKDSIHVVKTFEEFQKTLEKEGGFLKATWCGTTECEVAVKEKTTATIRVLAKDKPSGKCVHCEKEGKHVVYFGKAY